MDDERASKVGRTIGIGVLLAVVVFGVWTLTTTDSNPDKRDPADYRATPADAERMCRENVVGKLKAPSTAEFGGVTTTGFGDEYTVTGWVDAENSFGATLRTDWTCEAVHTGRGSWRTRTTLD